MVEFALVGPIGFLLIFGAVVLAVVVTNQVALSNGVRDAARGAAICGKDTSATTTTALPDRSGLCTVANLRAYILKTVPQISLASINCASTSSNCITVKVVDNNGVAVDNPAVGQPDASVASACLTAGATAGTPYSIEVDVTYQQPLYAPMLGYFFGNGGTNTRTISAHAEAQCEQ